MLGILANTAGGAKAIKLNSPCLRKGIDGSGQCIWVYRAFSVGNSADGRFKDFTTVVLYAVIGFDIAVNKGGACRQTLGKL